MSYLIQETSREEREKYVKDALAISLLDAGEPTKETMEIVNLYIDGKMEIAEVQKKIIEKYTEEAKKNA